MDRTAVIIVLGAVAAIGAVRRLTEDASWVSQWAEGAAILPGGKQVAHTGFTGGDALGGCRVE